MDYKTFLPMIHKGGAGLLKQPGFVIGASAGGVLDTKVYARLGLPAEAVLTDLAKLNN